MPLVHRTEGSSDRQPSEWSSGIFKQPVRGPVKVTRDGFEGDGQADLRVHGGPDRAALLFPVPNYALVAHLTPFPIPFGGFGENLSLDGSGEDEVCIGDVFGVGGAVMEVSQPRLPCFKLGRRLGNPLVTQAVTNARQGGWYARVLQEGSLREGDALRPLGRPNPTWTIRRAFEVYLTRGPESAELAALPALSDLWKSKLLGDAAS